jgi:predicted SnoaL-like aldol condensation-catalyzing enzyme
MQTEDNKAIVEQFLKAMFAEEYEKAGQLIDHRGFSYYDASTGELQGLDEVERLFTNFHSRYPDLSITIDELADAERDQVVARYTMYGTHQGDNKQVAAEGMSISRIHSGKIQEVRVIWDTAGWVLQEIGRPNVAWRCWWWWCLGPYEPQEGMRAEEQRQ